MTHLICLKMSCIPPIPRDHRALNRGWMSLEASEAFMEKWATIVLSAPIQSGESFYNGGRTHTISLRSILTHRSGK